MGSRIHSVSAMEGEEQDYYMVDARSAAYIPPAALVLQIRGSVGASGISAAAAEHHIQSVAPTSAYSEAAVWQ